jgi:hypothetical protein
MNTLSHVKVHLARMKILARHEHFTLFASASVTKKKMFHETGTSSTPVVTAKTSASSVATLSVPATSLPTQPLPAQSLTMPTTSVSLKPPPAVFKTTTVPHSSAGSSAPNFTNPMTLTTGIGGETTTTTVTAATAASIPLLCGQVSMLQNFLLLT